MDDRQIHNKEISPAERIFEILENLNPNAQREALQDVENMLIKKYETEVKTKTEELENSRQRKDDFLGKVSALDVGNLEDQLGKQRFFSKIDG